MAVQPISHIPWIGGEHNEIEAVEFTIQQTVLYNFSMVTRILYKECALRTIRT
jgi:hypothetical protein